MNISSYTTQNLSLARGVWMNQEAGSMNSGNSLQQPVKKPAFDIVQPLRRWIDKVEVRNPKLARSLCKLIPAQCPFERDVNLLGRKLFHIPPMCKLNPVYEEIVGLRFRALCYLADVCGEDVTLYC